MVQLSFLEEVKDKASRLIPSAYLDFVEECTAPHLSIPIYEHVMFLCDTANSKPESLGDIVRALRRRITDDNPAVKHLVILLLDAMIKNCGVMFHAEICSQKGLLRDLEGIATASPTSARGMQAREAALTLILNLSVWFVGHPDERCHLMTTLAADVRKELGPNVFEGIRPDATVTLRIKGPSAAASGHSSAHPSRHRPHREKRPVVDAIAVKLPTDEMLSGMLDMCVALSEYLNHAAVDEEGGIIHDDVIHEFCSKIREDSDKMSILLSSNLKQLNRDVLRSVCDSQSSVLNRLKERNQPPPPGAATTTTAAPSAPTNTTTTTTAPTTAAVPVVKAASPEPPKSAPPPPPPPPSMDDIFGGAAPAGPSATTTTSAAREPQTEEKETAAASQRGREEEEEEEVPDIVVEESSPTFARTANAAVHVDVMQGVPGFESKAPAREDPTPEEPAAASSAALAGTVGTDNSVSQASASDAQEVSAPMVPEVVKVDSAAASPPIAEDDDDDFEAFLEGRS